VSLPEEEPKVRESLMRTAAKNAVVNPASPVRG
jgi:hypothetical protein